MRTLAKRSTLHCGKKGQNCSFFSFLLFLAINNVEMDCPWVQIKFPMGSYLTSFGVLELVFDYVCEMPANVLVVEV